jgi:hypothetical protein
MSLHFKLTQSSGNHLSHGGFPLVQRLFVEQGLPSLLDSSLPQPSPQAVYTASDVVFSFFYTVMMGGSCLEDLNYARGELRQIVGFQAPSADTLRTRLQSWSEENVESFSGPHGRIHDSFNYAPGMNAALKRTAALSLPPKRGGYRLDVDAHVLEHQKPDARTTYNFKQGYAPLCSFIGPLPVEVEMRGGNTSPKKDIKQHVERTIKALAKEGVRIKEVCSDAAGYNFELMKWLDKSRRRFYIRAVKCAGMEQQITEISQWHPVQDKRQNLLYEWAETTWKGYRLIVQRQKKEDGQTDVFSGMAYTYRAIITNDRRKKSNGLFVINHYNKRGGIERNFDILRNDFGWALMPFDNMSENTAYLLLTALCLNLFEWAKKLLAARTTLLGTTAIRVKNFLLRFASVPAQWVKTGRQIFLKLYTHRDYTGLLVPG